PAQALVRGELAGADGRPRACARRQPLPDGPRRGPAGARPGSLMGDASIAGLLAAVTAPPRPLGELIERLSANGSLRGAREGGRAIGPAALAEISVTGATDDSRAVAAGSLFVAVPGLHVDGHEFVPRAASAGAAVA